MGRKQPWRQPSVASFHHLTNFRGDHGLRCAMGCVWRTPPRRYGMTPSLIESPRFASAPFPSSSRPRSLALAPTCPHRCLSLRERGFSSPSFRRSERRLSPDVLSPERKATIQLREAGAERPKLGAVGGVPPVVAFRSAKGALSGRPFAGAKDYQSAECRPSFRSAKEHVDDIISDVLSPLLAAKKMALSGTIWHFLAGSAAPISFVKIDLGQIAPEFSAIFWHSPLFG